MNDESKSSQNVAAALAIVELAEDAVPGQYSTEKIFISGVTGNYHE